MYRHYFRCNWHTNPDVKRHLEAGKEPWDHSLQVLGNSEWRLLEWSGFELSGNGDEWEAISFTWPRILSIDSKSARQLGLNVKRDLVPSDESTVVDELLNTFANI